MSTCRCIGHTILAVSEDAQPFLRSCSANECMGLFEMSQFKMSFQKSASAAQHNFQDDIWSMFRIYANNPCFHQLAKMSERTKKVCIFRYRKNTTCTLHAMCFPCAVNVSNCPLVSFQLLKTDDIVCTQVEISWNSNQPIGLY